MAKLNWRDASKELPAGADEDGLPVMCLTLLFYKGRPIFGKDWISSATKKWAHGDDTVKYWVYLSEIPLPEE
ncbi:hypothetical protein GA0061081_102241 [Gilliamella bombicola]|uniref:Uncharacterized protein n=1 Tax=Gilliamella bombicola TaxID=1798182 RepID=A0A1C4A4S1_9GAMM|nr:hypothetical protein [Gilliamella bombicola]SCB89704.1 hypothetical protein GA0061081_102241 [Gilliamella bombicola]